MNQTRDGSNYNKHNSSQTIKQKTPITIKKPTMNPRIKCKRSNMAKKDNFNKQTNRKKERQQNTSNSKITNPVTSKFITKKTRYYRSHYREKQNKHIHRL